MKLTKMTSLSNLISNIRSSEPSTPSARGRGNFDNNKVVDIAPCKTPKENLPPFTPSSRAHRTPVVPAFPHNDAKDLGNFLDLAPSKSNAFFRLPSPRPKSRKEEHIRPEHISRPRPSPYATTPSFNPPTPSSAHSRHHRAQTPSDDYFCHRAGGPVERYGEHPYSQPQTQLQTQSQTKSQTQSQHYPLPRTPHLAPRKSTPALSTHHRGHVKLPSNKNRNPDVPVDALNCEREFEADFAECKFDPAMSAGDNVYYFKDLPDGRESNLKPLMLVERKGDKGPASSRYSFDTLSLSANHGISSSAYCF